MNWPAGPSVRTGTWESAFTYFLPIFKPLFPDDMKRPPVVLNLIEELKRLPGVGQKTAERLSFFLMRGSLEQADKLATAIRNVKDKIILCSECHGITESDPCEICKDSSRDGLQICVVEEPHNVSSVEKTRDFDGMYHVLMGALSPLQGIGPDDLKVKELLARVSDHQVDEVILATNPNVEGEATAIYLAKLLKSLDVRVTRIAMGVPVGSDLEYADEMTMHKALEGRRDF